MGKYKKYTFFSKEIKNPFSENIENKLVYQEILKELEMKENQEETKQKRNFKLEEKK